MTDDKSRNEDGMEIFEDLDDDLEAVVSDETANRESVAKEGKITFGKRRNSEENLKLLAGPPDDSESDESLLLGRMSNLEPGVYNAVIGKINMKWFQGKYGEKSYSQLIIPFKIQLPGSNQTKQVKLWTNKKLMGLLDRMVKEILEVNSYNEVDLSQLEGKKVVVRIELKEKDNGYYGWWEIIVEVRKAA